MPELDWLGKKHVIDHHNDVPFRFLKMSGSHSIHTSDNLLIEGDNLEALKSLLPYYRGRIKCIYIDPPYNTGNEKWVYNDNVNSPQIRKWLGKVVGIDDLSRHDKWLCMMYPRLVLLRDLLHEDGFIFVSIDDNEAHNLRYLLNDIFNESNFRSCIIIKRGPKSVQMQFDTVDKLGSGYETVLMYSKNKSVRFKKILEKLNESSKSSWNSHWRGTDRPTMRYPLLGKTPSSGQWRWDEKRSMQAVENYKNMLQDLHKTESDITQSEIDEWHAREKQEGGKRIDLLRLSDKDKPEHYVPETDTRLVNDVWFDIKPNGSKTLSKMKLRFDNPKPVALIKRIVQFMMNNDDTILDSFAGSGTTAQAVLELNNEDGGNRKFILIEMDSKIAKNITSKRIKNTVRSIGGGAWDLPPANSASRCLTITEESARTAHSNSLQILCSSQRRTGR